eukprot:6183686-Pleurochrysis_carterae.AAC.1
MSSIADDQMDQDDEAAQRTADESLKDGSHANADASANPVNDADADPSGQALHVDSSLILTLISYHERLFLLARGGPPNGGGAPGVDVGAAGVGASGGETAGMASSGGRKRSSASRRDKRRKPVTAAAEASAASQLEEAEFETLEEVEQVLVPIETAHPPPSCDLLLNLSMFLPRPRHFLHRFFYVYLAVPSFPYLFTRIYPLSLAWNYFFSDHLVLCHARVSILPCFCPKSFPIPSSFRPG